MEREDRFLTVVLALVGTAELFAATIGADWIADHRPLALSLSIGVLVAIETQIMRSSRERWPGLTE